jgi:hypothetical protein
MLVFILTHVYENESHKHYVCLRAFTLQTDVNIKLQSNWKLIDKDVNKFHLFMDGGKNTQAFHSSMDIFVRNSHGHLIVK